MPLNKIITIKDIAREAGVSICTVSNVINKTNFVSKKLTDRVNTIIKKYNYRMDISASSLRKKSSKMIGMIIPDSSSQFFILLTKKMEGFSRKIGYHLVICNSNYNSKIDIEHLEVLRSRNVDGIILLAADEDTNQYKKFFDYGIPIVLIERKIANINCDSVMTDCYDSISELIDYLVGLGHKKIAYIGREKNLYHSRTRLKSYIDSIRRNNLHLYEEFIINNSVGFRFSDGYKDMIKFLDLRDKPTAVLAFNDTLAIGAIRAIKDSGYKVPDDFSVAGFDDIEIDEYVEPKLTTISTMKEDITKITFKLLMDKILKKRKRSKQISVKTHLIIRESTGRAKN